MTDYIVYDTIFDPGICEKISKNRKNGNKYLCVAGAQHPETTLKIENF